MFQLPVNNLTRLRKARKKVKRLLSDIGLDYCKEHVEDFREFCSDEFYLKNMCLDVCMWDPSWTKSQDYRTKQFCCSDCPFASKYFSAYKNHFRNVHREDFENRILLNCSYCTYSGNKRTLETHIRLFHMPHNLMRQGAGSPQGTLAGLRDGVRVDRSLLGDRKEQAVYYCKKCTYRDRLYNVVRRHIYREHFQHVATPYVGRSSEKSQNSEAASANSAGIHCKSCLFVPRTYEALVQHVIEFHERIGHQVTALIGHTSVIVSRPQSHIIINQRATMMNAAQHVNCFSMPKMVGLPVGNHLKHAPATLSNVKGQAHSIAAQPMRITLPDKSLMSGTVSPSHSAKHLMGGKFDSLSFAGRVQSGLSVSHSSLKSLPLSSAMQAATATLSSKRASATAFNSSQTQKWKICTICNELFPENAYSAHFEKEHQAEKVKVMAKYIMKIHNFTSKCLYCNRYLPSDTLLNHMLVHGLSCLLCHSTFHEVEKVVAHKRQFHPNDTGDLPTSSPLTFDLTLQQGSPKNVQLIVTTCSMKEATEPSSTPSSQSSASVRVSKTCTKTPESQRESTLKSISQTAVPQKTEVGKTLCPLCFTILKGPISDALAVHLREQHQVLQTLHPVEKKLTYKCIHCLGVYTSNMTVSTITLHLVHCRGVGQTPRGQGSKPISTLRSTGTVSLKRELAASDASDPKRKKMVDQTRYYPTVFVEKPEEPVVLALDPKGHAEESYEARKAFLTAYFNRHPYPSQREVEKLAASLWLWKSDVSSHFANRRRSCERDFVTRKPVVLLGFNMRAVNRLKHDLNFDPEWFFENNNEDKSEQSRTSKGRLKDSVGFSYGEGNRAVQHKLVRQALNTGQSSQSNCAFNFNPVSFVEPIAIDSDSESEQEETSTENVEQRVKTVQNKGGLYKGPAFPPFNVHSQRKVHNFFTEAKEREMRPSTRAEAKSLDGSVTSSSPEEEIWSGSMSPDESHYRQTGLFEEKGNEVGLMGR
ncbi:activity-dependent neuroprotective protein a [Chanos chanos]|uniref:Activity-dependent neuroprotective protein a n=1 Tax=Chanos chanos TaxID=29144 RepID=A0A6J2VLU3_CHACN|nr:activity-dependent neuroprotector homeobox protein-like [Chanos chanos]